jgi:AbrB family looped-hinge helix DNA binding protein
MSKVTTKLQVSLPKVIAEQLGIKPGDKIDWEIIGGQLRVSPQVKKSREKDGDRQERLRLFDQATRRQRKRDSRIHPALIRAASSGRGWRREDLYNRGKNRRRRANRVTVPESKK